MFCPVTNVPDGGGDSLALAAAKNNPGSGDTLSDRDGIGTYENRNQQTNKRKHVFGHHIRAHVLCMAQCLK